MFDVGPTLPIDSVPAGTNLLVGGPVMSRKREIVRDVLETGLTADENGLIISTRDSADRVLSSSEVVRTGLAEGRVGIIDCVTRERGGTYRESENVRYVATPGEVTEVGIRASGFFQRFDATDEPVRMTLGSVSTMLMYAEKRRVFRFMNVLTGQIQQHDWLGLTVIETDDRTAFDTFAPLFDGMVQTRRDENSGRVEVRVLGLESAPTEWVPI